MVRVWVDLGGILVHVGSDEVVGNNVPEKIEPEQGNLGQDLSFVGNASREDVVERGNAIGCHKQETVAIETVNVSDLPAGMKLEILEFGAQQDGIEDLWAHGQKFYRQKTWRILAAHKYLSTIYVIGERDGSICLNGKPLTPVRSGENARQMRHLEEIRVWKT